jgi:molecular chaperone DnaJ
MTSAQKGFFTHQRKLMNKVIQDGIVRNFSTGGKKDFYETLEVPKNASQSDIKKKYFELAKKFHPDVNKTPEAKEKFAAINNAYETLSDEGKRKVYD